MKKTEFSKALLIQESALIWTMTLSFIFLAGLCIVRGYTGSLPWLTAMVSLPWTAYGVSQCFYYHKSTKENTIGGIKYETVMTDLVESYKVPNYEAFIPEDNNEFEGSFQEDNEISAADLDYGI